MFKTSKLIWIGTGFKNSSLARTLIHKHLTQLDNAGLTIVEKNGDTLFFGDRQAELQANIQIKNQNFYYRMLKGGSIAAAESYMDGEWDSSNLTNLVRVIARNTESLDRIEERLSWFNHISNKLFHSKRKNNLTTAKRNIAAHYDIGNDLYSSFLDSEMLYSSAIYHSGDESLEQAQIHKMQRLCEKLKLNADDHLLEIGTGWGALAIYAAKHYGCKVTTTTISEEQFELAKTRIEQAGLSDKITLVKQDYRKLQGQFDKIVSVEMIEAVGEQYLSTFIQQCQSLLKPNGLMMLQLITIADHRYDSYRNSVDFIQRYIFPGGFLPSVSQLLSLTAKHSDFVVRDLYDMGLDYARTLADWHQRFNQQTDQLATRGYDERFMRMWRFYLSYCEGGFMERTISAVQLLFGRAEFRGASR
jgi:cyclopropane-fatty-acyl-phospholipid synthase